MYHSVSFVTSGLWHPVRKSNIERRINTWNDWHLIPTVRPVVSPPSVIVQYVESNICDGSFDFTDYLVREPIYAFCEGSWTFIVENGFREWYELYSDIMDSIHGQYVRIILEDDPSHFYEGRICVDNWKSDRHKSEICFKYKLKAKINTIS